MKTHGPEAVGFSVDGAYARKEKKETHGRESVGLGGMQKR
jgi:hypothetical protein